MGLPRVVCIGVWLPSCAEERGHVSAANVDWSKNSREEHFVRVE